MEDRRLGRALKNLWNYESSIGLPEEGRSVIHASDGLRLKQGIEPADVRANDRHIKDWLLFGANIDQILAEWTPGEPIESNDFVYVRHDTPQALIDLGFPDQPFIINSAHVLSCMLPEDTPGFYHCHDLGIYLMKRLPELLERPSLVCDDPGSIKQGRSLIVTTEADNEGNPIIIPVEPTAARTYDVSIDFVSRIYTMYGKNNYLNYFGGSIAAEQVVLIQSGPEADLDSRCGTHVFASFDELNRDKVLKTPNSVLKLEGKQIAEQYEI